ncbi:MAG: ComF family protein, partial [Muribaculaceae bacterium]|nr:ComF family protein [Muribaculaceae bacterium]
MSKISEWLSNAVAVIMPRACAVCGKPLAAGEKWLCRRCLDEIPVTQLHTIEFNDMEKLFATYRIERATGYFYYEKSNPYAKILHDIKYRNMPTMGQWLAARAATQIA